MNKKYFFIAITMAFQLFIGIAITKAQPISPYLFGQNAWMPDSIGKVKFFGRLHQNWHHVEASSAQTVRFGGIGPDDNMPTNFQYIQMIDSIRNRGMEPIMQVPYYGGKYSARQAAEIVRYINITMKKNIKYWIIGNEPDHVYYYTRANQVAPYLRDFSFAMKDADPSIKIIGPETAWFNRPILSGLTNPGGPDDVTGKDSKGRYIIDYISFHSYPFSGNQTRQQVVDNLRATGEFSDELAELKGWLKNANKHHKRTGEDEIKMAVTEANICFRNNQNDNLDGNGATSFIGGQFWAEFLGISMKHEVTFFNFWSVLEGNGQPLNIGYIDRTTNRRQPSWHHFKMMADNFRGEYLPSKTSRDNAKPIACRNEKEIVVMLMNQSEKGNRNFTIHFNKNASSNDDPIKINVDAGLDKTFKGHIRNQTTLLLTFDFNGNITRRCEYSLENHARKNTAPTCTDIEPAIAKISASSNAICEEGELEMSVNELKGYTYQWHRDEEEIDGATGLNYRTSTPGSYSVSVSLDRNTTFSQPFEAIAVNNESADINAEGPTNICNTMAVTLQASQGPAFSYTWQLNGVEIPGTDTSAYEATIPGEYSVAISNDCGEQVSSPLEVEGCSGISQSISNSEENQDKIYTYPNPNNGIFTVEMQTDDTSSEIAVMEIINTEGKLILITQANLVNGYIRQPVSLDPHLPPGAYTIRVKIGENIYTDRVMIRPGS